MNERVMKCPLRECDGRALVTYRATVPESSPSLRIITDIACDGEGCRHYVAPETLVDLLGRDPREHRRTVA